MNTQSKVIAKRRPGISYWAVLMLPIMGVTTGVVQALSFNELYSVSALGEPLDVRLSASGLEEDFDPARLRVASQETYEKMGLVWPEVLRGAEVQMDGHGADARIRVRTRARASEPMMTLLLEAREAGGLTRREYTLLLDPPVGPYTRSSAASPLASLQPPLHDTMVAGSEPPARAIAARPITPRVALVQPAEPRLRQSKAAVVAAHAARPRLAMHLAAASLAPFIAASPAPPVEVLRYRPLHLRSIFSLHPAAPAFTASVPVRLQLVQRISADHLKRLPAAPALRLSPVLPAVVAGSAGQAQPFSAGKLLPWWLLIAACGVIVLQALALRRRLRPAPVAPGAVRSKPTLAPPGERYSEAEPPAPTLRVSPSADRPLPKPAVLSKPESELTLEMPVQLPVAEPTPSATAASRIAAPLISLPEPQTPPRRLPAPLPTLPLESAFEQRQAVPVYVAPLTTSAEEDVQLEVARVLSNALRYAPQRLDLRYKLLEIHHAKVQKEAFIENARLYAEEMRGQNDPAWAAIVNMGQTLAPTEPLFAVSIPGSTGPSDHGKRAARHFDNLDEYQLGARLAELHEQYTRLSGSPAYTRALEKMYHRECERPTTLSRALRLSEEIAGAQILVKREDLRAAREGQRLNAFGQVMLAKHLGKKRVVIGTRSGMFGEAMARAAHTLGLPLRAYMPKTLASNVKHPSLRLMKMLDVEIIGQPNADPRRAALRDWLAEPEVAFYATGLDAGPPPYPAIVVDLQAVIGLEVLQQSKDVAPEGVHAVVCPRASGVTSMGFMQPMMNNPLTALHCVDNGGKAITDESEHSYMREHAWMRATGRVQYSGVSMTEVYNAAERGGRLECFPQDGCNAATLAKAISVASTLQRSQVVVALFINPLEVQANLEKVDFPL